MATVSNNNRSSDCALSLKSPFCICCIESCDKDAQAIRQIDIERRLREGEELEMTGTWKGKEVPVLT